MSNAYACTGPNIALYRQLQAQFKHAGEALAHISQLERHWRVFPDIKKLKDFYRANELGQPTAASFRYFVWDMETDEPEIEIYPDASWTVMGTMPDMHPLHVQESGQAFDRLMSPMDAHDNYALIPIRWRGFERRVIAQVYTQKGEQMLPEGDQKAVFRPMYLELDAAMIAQLEAHIPDMARAEVDIETEKPAEPDAPLTSDVIDLSAHKNKTRH